MKPDFITHSVPNPYTSVYEFMIDREIIDRALQSAYTLRYLGLSLDGGSYDPSLSNAGPNGERIITDLAFMSVFDIHTHSQEIRDITTIVEQQCHKISKTKYNVDLTFQTYQSALVFYEPGSQISSHDHFPHTFVGTVYLEVEEGASPIVFGKDHAIHPRVGMCLISPGNLHHAVPPTDGTRTVLAINIRTILP